MRGGDGSGAGAVEDYGAGHSIRVERQAEEPEREAASLCSFCEFVSIFVFRKAKLKQIAKPKQNQNIRIELLRLKLLIKTRNFLVC